MWEKQNTESKCHKQKLITKFTPSTGLRLRVPLQWVPIQLISLKWYKMVLESTSATVKQNAVQSLQDLLFWKLQNGLQKEKKPLNNRVQSTYIQIVSGHFTAKLSELLFYLCKLLITEKQCSVF